MEKEALIKMILQDVKELDTLLNAFAGKTEIPKALIRLSRNRVAGILDEIDLLEYILNTPAGKKPVPVKPAETQPQPVLAAAEPEKTEPIPAAKTQNADEVPVTVQKPAEVPAVAETKSEETVTLGEKLMHGSQSLYDTLTQKKEEPAPRFQSQPVKDIKSAIGINDRFYFQRELFGNNAELFNSTVEQLNAMKDMDAAEKYFAATFKWDAGSEAVQLFKEIVKRRYL